MLTDKEIFKRYAKGAGYIIWCMASIAVSAFAFNKGGAFEIVVGALNLVGSFAITAKNVLSTSK